jgi:two-component system, NarL family, sensor histidine kinase UhpB
MYLSVRIYLINAVVFAAGALVLALGPATVSYQITLPELTVLVAGLAAMLIINFILISRTLAPLQRLSDAMHSVDLMAPRQQLQVQGPPEVGRLVSVFNQMLDRLDTERRDSTRRVLDAQEAERQRVAHELHDEVGQGLTAVLLHLDSLARRAPDPLHTEFCEAQEITRQTLEEIRRISRRLRPEALDDLGLVPALIALTTSFAQATGLLTTRDFAADLPPLDPESELVVYRIAQESLTNVARHARATQVKVHLERGGRGGVRLQVSDNGRGLNGAVAGAGIAGMKERALLIGGELAIHSPSGTGVRVQLQVPGRL